jgi:hypothetical protein
LKAQLLIASVWLQITARDQIIARRFSEHVPYRAGGSVWPSIL